MHLPSLTIDRSHRAAPYGRDVEGATHRKKLRVGVYPWPIRVLALILSFLLSLTGSSPLMAITMGQIKAGVAGGTGGGQGSAPNLQNAGAASAAMTAALTKKSQQQSAAVVAAMQKLQAQAAAAAKANPATVLPNGQTVNSDSAVYNGLKAGWLEPYLGKNNDGSLKPGFDDNGNPITDPKNGGTWSGASIVPSSVPVHTADPNYVNIKQSAQNAYLYWNQFNVGPQTTVNFDQSAGGQSAGNWIAFNKVMNASDPSHIFGNITAQGQVYVLNQNGILFHNGSTVNTHSLVASTLPINVNLAGDALDKVSGRGIANNPAAQFLFSSFAVPSDNQDKNGFDPTTTTYGVSAAPGDVVVERGAKIVSPVNEAGVGGLVALIGPNVRNDGILSTTAGQTILAAGLQVALIPHPSTDPSLRGMDVTVGLVSDSTSMVNPVNTPLNGTAGSVVNNGLVSAPVGDITLAGKGVFLGSLADDVTTPVNGGKMIGAVLDSTTSVALNGRIDLIASSGATKNTSFGVIGPAYIQGSTGLIDIGQGSVLQILPEWSANSSVVGTALSLNSIADFVGQSIHFGRNAILEMPGAAVTPGSLSEAGQSLTSGISLLAGQWFNSGSQSSSSSPSQLLATEGQIYIESGAVIDASGSSGVIVDSSQNYLTLQLRGPELANSPLQRDNKSIRGKDITVDGRIAGTADGKIIYFPTVADAYAAYQAGTVTWIGTPLGNVTGFAGLIQRRVGQLTEVGGSVSLSAGDSVVLQSGSSINVSGGWTQYSGGNFATTKLLTADGRLVDISKATADQVYAGIMKDSTSVNETPYMQGASGGSLSISAPAMALQGDLYGVTVTGARQLRTSATTSMLPGLSSLNLTFQGMALVNNLQGVAVPVNASSPQAPIVTFSYGASVEAPSFSIDAGTGLPTPLEGSLSPELNLSPSLISSRGFGRLAINDHDGEVVVPAGVALDFPALGSLTVNASVIDVSGKITAPGGSVSLTADLVPFALANNQLLIQDGVLSQPFLGVLISQETGDGLTQGEQVFQYGQPDENGNQAVYDATGTEFVVSGSLLESSPGGTVSIARGSSISTAGLLVNDGYQTSIAASSPVILNGGTIALSASRVSLSHGSLLDVSGGAILPSSLKGISYGKGGALTIAGGIDP